MGSGREFATLLHEFLTAQAQFLECRLLWQFTTPIQTRVAATLPDPICIEVQRRRDGMPTQRHRAGPGIDFIDVGAMDAGGGKELRIGVL